MPTPYAGQGVCWAGGMAWVGEQLGRLPYPPESIRGVHYIHLGSISTLPRDPQPYQSASSCWKQYSYGTVPLRKALLHRLLAVVLVLLHSAIPIERAPQVPIGRCASVQASPNSWSLGHTNWGRLKCKINKSFSLWPCR